MHSDAQVWTLVLASNEVQVFSSSGMTICSAPIHLLNDDNIELERELALVLGINEVLILNSE